MTDADAVAAALARLANGTAGAPTQVPGEPTTTDQSSPPPPAAVVAEAQRALTRLQSAAAFVDDDGQWRLSQAITEAERSGDQAVADQGKELLGALDRFTEAANPASVSTDRQPPDDHFHRAHATLLAGDGVDPKR